MVPAVIIIMVILTHLDKLLHVCSIPCFSPGVSGVEWWLRKGFVQVVTDQKGFNDCLSILLQRWHLSKWAFFKQPLGFVFEADIDNFMSGKWINLLTRSKTMQPTWSYK